MEFPERKAQVCKVRVRSVKMFVSPSAPYRTTKGGKRILIGEPGYVFICELFCEEVPQLRTREYVLIGNNVFMYIADTRNDIYKLRNAEVDSKIPFEIDTEGYIDAMITAKVYGEGTEA